LFYLFQSLVVLLVFTDADAGILLLLLPVLVLLVPLLLSKCLQVARCVTTLIMVLS